MNNPLQLCYPVKTLTGRELLPAGAYLSRDTMKELIHLAGRETYPARKLMEFAAVAADLQCICNKQPYCRIFSDPVRQKELLKTMQQVEFTQPLLDIYGFFKACDPYTYRHILTVFALTLLLAQDLINDREELARAVAAAPTHDFGKICVPVAVCKKTTPLNLREQALLSHHAAAGYVLLSFYLKEAEHPAATTARDHHERRDGSGYPRQITLRNRVVEIVAVGDVFDALISSRPYRPQSYDLRTALEELSLQARSGAISEDVVNTLISYNRENHPCHTACRFSHELRGTPPPGNHYQGITPCRYEPADIQEEKPGV
ncbi:MAG: HD domain-containing protein [Deltaproteobacteria bacterium]|nr:HD domain-containing protein [Deltaproteobacteria bacterium]TLN00948.1 MAG: HD domain-containing protein [bacterium]